MCVLAKTHLRQCGDSVELFHLPYHSHIPLVTEPLQNAFLYFYFLLYTQRVRGAMYTPSHCSCVKEDDTQDQDRQGYTGSRHA
jgi:hypothetical protein